MQMQSLLLSAALASILGGCAAQTAQQPSQRALADCGSLGSDQTVATLYSPGKLTSVQPTYRQEFVARAIQPRYVSGASLYVSAEPGLTRAYLQRALTCHAASTASVHPSDPLRAAGVASITVSEAGAAMRISIQGTDRASGKAIWQRARTLHEQPGQVSVEQLSAAPVQPRF